MENIQPISISDINTASQAIVELIRLYPNYPQDFKPSGQTVQLNRVNGNKSIGVYPLQGAKKLKQYVNGSYVGLINYQIVYKSSPQDNANNYAAEELLSGISGWLESCKVELNNNMGGVSIAQSSTIYPVTQDQKTTEYAVNIQLQYTFKK